MIIGILGLGVVGQAIYNNFSKFRHSLVTFDTKHDDQFAKIISSDYVFVCVPTDTLPDGTCDLTSVEQCLNDLNLFEYQGVVIVKSTVLPGTTESLQIKHPTLKLCFIPEFLRQDHATEDYPLHQKHLIIGCNNDEVFEKVKFLHKDFSEKFYKVSMTEAEFVKYFVNTFNALRVVFANIFYESCKHKGADYNKVLQAAITRDAIGHDNYLKCTESMRGFNGKCLPKDTQAFTEFLKRSGISNDLFKSILDDNERFN
jgi:UDPglucose 6-dehydrogenase